MALQGPLRSTAGNILSPFSPHTEFSLSPSTESPSTQYHSMPSSATDPNSLRPSSAARNSTAQHHLMSPNDIGPSPVTSVGTEITEIDDEASEEAGRQPTSANPEPEPQLSMLSTNIADQVRQATSEEAVSVIHAPESFQNQDWMSTGLMDQSADEMDSPNSAPEPSIDTAVVKLNQSMKVRSPSTPNPPPLSTNIRPVRFSLDSATPRAQTLQEAQALMEASRLRSSSTNSLELIPESREFDTDHEREADDEEEFVNLPIEEDMEIKSLKTALQECWTLCNTLATLSTHHRERVFSTSGTPDGYERAWKSCWKLCQRLYDSRDEDEKTFMVKINLDLCRDFCQSLFDIRQRKDEVADSVLRVSFELNNHLYSSQDNRHLPEIFRERTLDFYITLCHRLMKQRSEFEEETDSLLRACWALAEMLFSIRQNKRDGRPDNDELLGSAVQACWELCDIFREGWTQIRPDRNTPKPSSVNFFGFARDNRDPEPDARASSRASNRSKRDSLRLQDKLKPPIPAVPETPVTEFEDTPLSPGDTSPTQPNILVLGTDGNRSGRWSSSASQRSGYSQNSQRTSSTATTATSLDDGNIMRIKVLIVKAAMNVGYRRDEPSGPGGVDSLQTFVGSLSTGSFGALPLHATLLSSYKNLVLGDSSFRHSTSLPARGKRVLATEVAKSVGWMTHRSNQYNFLRDLFKLVFGFYAEEAESRKNVAVVV